MAKAHTGRCACGAVQFEFDEVPEFAAVCHCNDCKKASGGEAATFFAVKQDDFTVVSGTPKGFGYVANSGKKLERMFCPDCGARLYTRNLESFPGLVFVTIGSLDVPAEITPTVEMFTKRRLTWAVPLKMLQFNEMPS